MRILFLFFLLIISHALFGQNAYLLIDGLKIKNKEVLSVYPENIEIAMEDSLGNYQVVKGTLTIRNGKTVSKIIELTGNTIDMKSLTDLPGKNLTFSVKQVKNTRTGKISVTDKLRNVSFADKLTYKPDPVFSVLINNSLDYLLEGISLKNIPEIQSIEVLIADSLRGKSSFEIFHARGSMSMRKVVCEDQAKLGETLKTFLSDSVMRIGDRVIILPDFKTKRTVPIINIK
jgi:hypothetical protein